MVSKISDVDPRPLSNTLKRHEDVVSHHGNYDASNHHSSQNKTHRSRGVGGWLSTIAGYLKPIWNTASTAIGMFGGPEGRLVSGGMNALSTGLGMFGNHRSDEATGSFKQGLTFGGY